MAEGDWDVREHVGHGAVPCDQVRKSGRRRVRSRCLYIIITGTHRPERWQARLSEYGPSSCGSGDLTRRGLDADLRRCEGGRRGGEVDEGAG